MSKKLNKLEGNYSVAEVIYPYNINQTIYSISSTAQMKVMAEAQAEQNVFLRNLHKHGDQTLKDARSVYPIKTEEDLLSLNSKIYSENRVLHVSIEYIPNYLFICFFI